MFNETRLDPNNNDNDGDDELRGKKPQWCFRGRKKLHNFKEIWEQGYVGSLAMCLITFDINYFVQENKSVF